MFKQVTSNRQPVTKSFFTMIELLIVIGVIGILASMLIGTMGGGVGKSKETEAKAIMAKIVAAAISNQGLTGSTSSFSASDAGVSGKDPWGNNIGSAWDATWEPNFERWEITVTNPETSESIYSWKDN